MSSNIPASSAYGDHISQLIRYSRACAPYSDFLDIAQLLTQKILKQGYVPPKLRSPLQTFYSRHHHLVNIYEIALPQITQDLFLLTYIFLFPLSPTRLLPDCVVSLFCV